MSKYYLKLYLENGKTETLVKGSLEQIDNFIIKNNIKDINDLYEYCSISLSNYIVGNIEFKIEYQYDEQTKQKPILYKESLQKFRKDDSHILMIHNLIQSNEKFKTEFYKKYFDSILKSKNEVSLFKYIINYIKKPNEKTFSEFYIAYITKKKSTEKEHNLDYTNGEIIELISSPMYSYTRIRDFYTLVEKYINGKAISTIYIETENEFENLQIHDQNPDTGLRGLKNDDEPEISDKKNVKRLKKNQKFNENQISFFDN